MEMTECPFPELCKREFADMKNDIRELNKSFKELSKTLTVSNGSPCVIEQVHMHGKDIETLKDAMKEHRSHTSKYSDMAASAFINVLVLALLGLVGAMVLWETGVIGK